MGEEVDTDLVWRTAKSQLHLGRLTFGKSPSEDEQGVIRGDPYGCFLKWWYPATMGFPTKNDHFGGVLGVPPFSETPILQGIKLHTNLW